jgi:hypothetical protein
MVLRSSWEAAICAATQELPSIVWNPKVNYSLYQSLHWSISWARSIQSISSHSISLRSILLFSTHPRLGLPNGLFPPGFPTNILYTFSFPHSCYMPYPSYPPSLYHSNYIWRRVHIMKFLIMQFSPSSCHFISRRSKYFPHYSVLKNPQSMFLP